MRIIHVVTLISPDGAYGGPVRVATNQARALIAEGHDVTILAAHRGFDGAPPVTFDGVPVMLFPARTMVPGIGFGGLSSPGLQRWLRKNIGSIDVLHVHLARDFVTLPAANLARRTKTPFVTQTHGMIMPSHKRLARPLDTIYTQPVLRSADTAFFLTDVERTGLTQVSLGTAKLERLHNGVPLVVVPSFTESQTTEVLFLARLHRRKRPMHFVEMAKALVTRFPEATFTLVGPDEGEGAAVSEAVERSAAQVTWEGALSPEKTAARISKSAIYVLPSVDEPFPMSVLEAMAAGKPVIVTDSCGLAPYIVESQAGLVVDDTLAGLTDAVSALLSDSELRSRMSANATACIESTFRMESVVAQLSTAYKKAVSLKESPRP